MVNVCKFLFNSSSLLKVMLSCFLCVYLRTRGRKMLFGVPIRLLGGLDERLQVKSLEQHHVTTDLTSHSSKTRKASVGTTSGRRLKSMVMDSADCVSVESPGKRSTGLEHSALKKVSFRGAHAAALYFPQHCLL